MYCMLHTDLGKAVKKLQKQIDSLLISIDSSSIDRQNNAAVIENAKNIALFLTELYPLADTVNPLKLEERAMALNTFLKRNKIQNPDATEIENILSYIEDLFLISVDSPASSVLAQNICEFLKTAKTKTEGWFIQKLLGLIKAKINLEAIQERFLQDIPDRLQRSIIDYAQRCQNKSAFKSSTEALSSSSSSSSYSGSESASKISKSLGNNENKPAGNNLDPSDRSTPSPTSSTVSSSASSASIRTPSPPSSTVSLDSKSHSESSASPAPASSDESLNSNSSEAPLSATSSVSANASSNSNSSSSSSSSSNTNSSSGSSAAFNSNQSQHDTEKNELEDEIEDESKNEIEQLQEAQKNYLSSSCTYSESLDALESEYQELKINVDAQEESLRQAQENIKLLESTSKEITENLNSQHEALKNLESQNEILADRLSQNNTTDANGLQVFRMQDSDKQQLQQQIQNTRKQKEKVDQLTLQLEKTSSDSLNAATSAETMAQKISEDKLELAQMLAFKDAVTKISEQGKALGEKILEKSNELQKIIVDRDGNVLKEEESNSPSPAGQSNSLDGLESACEKLKANIDAQVQYLQRSQEEISSFETELKKINTEQEQIPNIQSMQNVDNIYSTVKQKLKNSSQGKQQVLDRLKEHVEYITKKMLENKKQLEQMPTFKKSAEEIAQQDKELTLHLYKTSQELTLIKDNLPPDLRKTTTTSLKKHLALIAVVEKNILQLEAAAQTQTNRLSALKKMPTNNNAICLSIAQTLEAQINATTRLLSSLKSEKDRVKMDIQKIMKEREKTAEKRITDFVSDTSVTFRAYLTERAATFKWRDKIGAALYAVANFFRSCFGYQRVYTEKEKRVFYIENLLIPALQKQLMPALLHNSERCFSAKKLAETFLDKGMQDFSSRAKKGQPGYNNSLCFFLDQTKKNLAKVENGTLQNNAENSAANTASR